jgi:hypothetical protein
MKKSIRPFSALIFFIILTSFIYPGKKPLHQTRQFRNTFAYVETGTLYQNNEVIELGNYYMSSHEVSNAEYQEFLTAIKTEGRTQELATAQIDTAQWEMFF